MSILSPATADRHQRSMDSLHPLLTTAIAAARTFLSDQPCELYCFWGFRSRAVQNTLQKAGKSNAIWGQSWHNVYPALAMDVVPVWYDTPRAIEWTSDRTKDVLYKLARSMPWLTWGHDIFKGDIYHFQIPTESGPHKFGVDWDRAWALTFVPETR